MSSAQNCTVDYIDLTGSIDSELARELCALCCFALESDPADAEWTVSVIFTDDKHLTRLHAEFMGIDEPTDILTFPDDEEPGGEIVISVSQAERQSVDDGWGLAGELRFLVVHGALHLIGWDDATLDQRASMLARQRELIALFQAGSPSNR